MHIGTDPKRTDKFYRHLPELVRYLKTKGYQFQTVDQMIQIPGWQVAVGDSR